ncbi:MAG: lysine--tRNA ligase [Candidatus Coatesbacteria bacterium]|nr:lysine--tRNA ligase [Candidatus Coatesbacteria bacterium]
MSFSERDSRLSKIEIMKGYNEKVYKARFERTYNLKEASNLPDDTKDVSVAGRITASRDFGKLSFLKLTDWEGNIQIAIEQNSLGKEQFDYARKIYDVGDHIGVKGDIFTTKTGEKTVLAKDFILLSKSLHPLPEKWHGLTDVESCYRYRYLDLIMNPASRQVFKLRTKIIRSIRNFLDSNGFEEVDTPVLVTQKSGALAKPFKTHHNSLDMEVFLRIAPETYLKRCIAGGYDKVYEVARVFRNEGIDASHLQDFTMLEYYCAYWDFEDNMNFTEKLVKHVIKEVTGSLSLTFKNNVLDFSGVWKRQSFQELIKSRVDLDINDYPDTKSLGDAIKSKGLTIEDSDKLGRGSLIDQLYKQVVRPSLIQPTFLIYHPIDLSPLARRNDLIPDVADRFQLIANSWEIVNAYSELIDPVDQKQRLEIQAKLRTEGDEDALDMDDDFIKCLETGLPPVSGWGMGIDRFVALLANCENLRDVILFPLMKPLQKENLQKSSEEDPMKIPSLENLDISLEKAWEIFNKYVFSENLKNHCISSAGVMKALARYLKQDETKWFILGLLHDLDFETNKEPDNHGLGTAEILKKEGFSEDIISLILSHNAEGLNLPSRKNRLEYLLAAGETITGLIFATALVYPDRKVASVEVKSVTKRMNKKDFARNVSRETIMECEKAGLKLDEFVGIALQGMREVSDKIGL